MVVVCRLFIFLVAKKGDVSRRNLKMSLCDMLI